MHTESQLVLPAIEVIRAHGGKCDTGDLISSLKTALTLDESDKQLLPSGESIRFDQIVRNLKSNKALENMGLVTSYQGGFILTEKGMVIETTELENLVVVHFAKETNVLTTQAAMVEYVKDIAQITFKNSKQAAKDILKAFKAQPTPQNDTERRETMKNVIDQYQADER